jgi:hypothetical protein
MSNTKLKWQWQRSNHASDPVPVPPQTGRVITGMLTGEPTSNLDPVPSARVNPRTAMIAADYESSRPGRSASTMAPTSPLIAHP